MYLQNVIQEVMIQGGSIQSTDTGAGLGVEGGGANVTFDHIERNVPVSPDEVSFVPPAGVDVIGTPQK